MTDLCYISGFYQQSIQTESYLFSKNKQTKQKQNSLASRRILEKWFPIKSKGQSIQSVPWSSSSISDRVDSFCMLSIRTDTWCKVSRIFMWRDYLKLTTHTENGTPSESEVAQLCPTLCNPFDCSLPGSSLDGVLQARILEWIAISFSRGSSWPRDQTRVSHIAGRCFNLWATREAQKAILFHPFRA